MIDKVPFTSLPHMDGLVQEKRNSGVLAMELRPSCTNPSIYYLIGDRLRPTTVYDSSLGRVQFHVKIIHIRKPVDETQTAHEIHTEHWRV